MGTARYSVEYSEPVRCCDDDRLGKVNQAFSLSALLELHEHDRTRESWLSFV